MTAIFEENMPMALSLNVVNRKESESAFSLPKMTKKELKRSAIEHGGYTTPALNDQLYLHYKGYSKIENLEAYANLKALWLDSNGFQAIENLNHLSSLRCLYLQRNLISSIENLDGLHNLVQLDISENRVRTIEGLSSLTSLATLNVSKNSLCTAESISHLCHCKQLSTVDFSHNQLKGEEIIDVFASFQALLSTNMTGNPVVSEISNFRKRIVTAVKTLKYLDRPIFEMERATTEAWASGGRSAEREMKNMLLARKREEERMATKKFRAWQEEIRSVAKEDEETIMLNGPTKDQLDEAEENERVKNERVAEASREAARERAIYRIKTYDDSNDWELIQKDCLKLSENKKDQGEKQTHLLKQKSKKESDEKGMHSGEVDVETTMLDGDMNDSTVPIKSGEKNKKTLSDVNKEIAGNETMVRPLQSFVSSSVEGSKRINYQGMNIKC